MSAQAKDTTYNGWTNYETWNVKLWIDNEEGDYEYWREQAQECWNDATPGEYEWETRERMFVRDLAERLKENHEERSADMAVTGVFADLLGAALSEVNWYEIAESYIEDIEQDDPETV